MDVLAERLGLSKPWVRTVLKNPRREALRAAGLKPVPSLPDEQPPAVGE
jgi:hypothetical protein